MYTAYQYLLGAVLSLAVSTYIVVKGPKTLTLKTLTLFGLVVTAWEITIYLYTTAPSEVESIRFFGIMLFFTHMCYPLFLLTFLSIKEKSHSRNLILTVLPFLVDAAVLVQPGYLASFEMIPTEVGWSFAIPRLDALLAIDGIIYFGYLTAILIGLVGLIRKTTFALLRRKYMIFLASFVGFQLVGILTINMLMAYNLLGPSFSIGGLCQFFTFVSIWYALSLKEERMPTSIEGRDFPHIYSFFLTEFYNSVTSSRLGEDVFRFTDFLKISKIEDQVSLDGGRIVFRKTEDLDLAELVNRNLEIFSEGHFGDQVVDHYLRVLNAASLRLGWRFGKIVKANMSFLKKSDLIYGILEGKFLEEIDEDDSLRDLGDLNACLKIYRRILLPIAMRIHENAMLMEKLSEDYVTQAMISKYGEISINRVKERLPKVPKDQQVPLVIEKFNSFLSRVYEELLTGPDADAEAMLGKLKLVLRLNRDRAVALGVYPTLLGSLATKIPKAQTYKLYSDYLEEMMEERTRELREAQESLLKSQRLVAIGEAAAMVGHDLRNPLQAIVNTLYLADKKLESYPDGGLKEVMKTISEQVEYMNKIVSDLQDYARPMEPMLVETDLHWLLDETFSSVKFPQNVSGSIEIEEGFPELLVDQYMMKRVLVNLLTNSLQAMPDGGHLTVRASQKDGDAFICVQDSGVGIPEENLDRIFKPLFTTKSKGQGLGLAVCKRMVEALGGVITLDSKVGESTTVTVKIPIGPMSSQGEIAPYIDRDGQ